MANRQAVTVSFDPFSSASPAYAATLPLFVVIFVVLILGVHGRRHRRLDAARANGGARARQLDGDVRALHDEMDDDPPPLRHDRAAAAAAGARRCAASRRRCLDALPVPLCGGAEKAARTRP